MISKAENFLKKNKICPVCAVKKLLNGVRVNSVPNEEFDNGAAKTPPMGWASWNLFGRYINEKIIEETADAMKALHLNELGYQYLNIDDCWMSSVRDTEGRLQGDLSTFPSGMKELVKKVNERGFKLGLYTSNGTFTCEDMPSSLYHEEIDAKTFAEWGVEYFKYDFCHNEAIPTAAPEIKSISLARPIEEDFLTRSCDSAELRGNAVILEDKHLSGDGRFIGGLDAAGGKAVFYSINVPESREYTLTLSIRKFGNYKKYAEVIVNGDKSYPVHIPPTKSQSKDGRVQISVFLNEGDNNLLIHNPIGSRMDSAAKQYRNMGLLLKKAAEEQAEKEGREVKPICYSICEWGINRPWVWGKTAGNLWRTTFDIKPVWASIVSIYERNVRLYKYASPGHFNDPDMLEVGNGKLTNNENRAHFTLWCMMAAPLILGNDLREFLLPDGKVDIMNETLRVITNRAAIAIDQDPLGIQCRRVKTNGLVDVLVKPLENRELAVCLFNKGPKAMNAEFSIKELTKEDFVSLPDAPRYTVTDIWENTTFVSQDNISASVNGHSVILYKIKATS
ncbi:MAG: alpha-galactosidase [Oscillospiraceae bacterium]|nr:alpha-galactosidase [Oscillospiraceae bacterium]